MLDTLQVNKLVSGDLNRNEAMDLMNTVWDTIAKLRIPADWRIQCSVKFDCNLEPVLPPKSEVIAFRWCKTVKCLSEDW